MATVAEVMTKNVQVIAESVSVLEALQKMKKFRIGCLVVVAGNEAIGILTDSDILYKVVAAEMDLKRSRVSAIMSRPLITIEPEATLDDAAALMARHKIKKLPIVDGNGKLVGIITATDLIRHSPEFSDILVQLRTPGGATFGA